MKKWLILASSGAKAMRMLLVIKDLKTHYRTAQGIVKAVDGVSLAIKEREVFGLAGESGCGKSTLIRTIMRLLPRSAIVSAQEMCFQRQDLMSMSDDAYRKKVLWKEISMVPQSAMNALNPVYRVGDQIAEAILAHSNIGKAKAWETAEELFKEVGLEQSLTRSYPHELSGGMRQRAMIAMSLALEPCLILMDEPTTGLDVLVQDRILRNFLEIKKRMKKAISIFLITHDISVIAEMSDRIGIMYAGRVMEIAETKELFDKPYHPYTLGLMNAFPSIRLTKRQLISIPGSPPNLIDDIPGCVFSARCPFELPECNKERPREIEVNEGHIVACIRIDDVREFRRIAGDKQTWQSLK